jgi:hypothetical protein
MIYTELLFFSFPWSGILETRKHDVSETGSVFRPKVKGGGEDTYWPLERANLNHSNASVRFTQPFNHSRPG